MDVPAYLRVALIYGHLLCCVFALHDVLATDYRLVLGKIDAAALDQVRRRMLPALIGLWLTGLAIVALDLNLDFGALASRPKMLTKLTVVVALTANGLLLLNRHAFPLLQRGGVLPAAALRGALASGAFSTASWLFAAFLGVAKPLARWPVAELLACYGALALLASVSGALIGQALATRRWRGLGHAMTEAGAAAADNTAHDTAAHDSVPPPQRLAA